MSQVAIGKCKDPDTISKALLEHIGTITDSIRKRAFNLFESRKDGSGSDLDDWLQAEKDVVWWPTADLIDDKRQFTARIALPGFDAKDIEVTAMPDALVIRADATHTHEGQRDSVCFCEFSEKKLFRRLELPSSIEVDQVSASLEKGI